MAEKKPVRKPTIGRGLPQGRGGARYRIRPIEPTGGGRIGGLLTPSAQGQHQI